MDSSVDPCTGVLIVDLDALARNYHRLRAAAQPAECAAVVKANAYGLGVVPVVRRLLAEGCRRFFVATLAEGLQLRERFTESTVYVLEGVLADSRERLLAARLTPVLNSLLQAQLWAPTGRPAALHLDTGMSRLGMSGEEVDALVGSPALLRRLSIEHVLTHLACADEPAHALNREQLERFDALRSKLPAARTSIGNSAGVFLGPAHCGDLARPGIGLYGGNPFARRASPVEPVVTLRGTILQRRPVREPLTVGYGASFEARPPTELVTVGIGYADGYPRSLGNRGVAVVGGARAPVVGRVSMDLLCLDVSGVPVERTQPGETVELIGGGVTLEEVAEAAGTVNYAILAGLGPRLRRIYRESGPGDSQA